MIENNINKKRTCPPENLEDLDRDPPDGPAGIAFFFFLIVTDESVIMKRVRAKSQPFSILILLILFTQCRKIRTCLIA